MRWTVGVVVGGLMALAIATPAHALDVGRITANVPIAGVTCTASVTIDDYALTALDPLHALYDDVVQLTGTSCGGGPVLCTAVRESQFGYDLYRQRGCSLTTTQLQLVCSDALQRYPGLGGFTETGCTAQGFGALVRCRTGTTWGGYAGAEATGLSECAAASPGAPIDLALVCGDYDSNHRFGYTDEVRCRSSVLSAGCSASQHVLSNGSWGECVVEYPSPSGTQTARYCTSPYFLGVMSFVPIGAPPVVAVPTRLQPAPPEGCSPS